MKIPSHTLKIPAYYNSDLKQNIIMSINPSYHLKGSLLVEANHHVPANAKFTSLQNNTSTEADKSRTNAYKFPSSPHSP